MTYMKRIFSLNNTLNISYKCTLHLLQFWKCILEYYIQTKLIYNFFPFDFLKSIWSWDTTYLPSSFTFTYYFFPPKPVFYQNIYAFFMFMKLLPCMILLEIILPSLSFLKYFLYQKERAEIVPKGTAVKEKVFKWFLLWQAQNLCAWPQYIQDYDWAYSQHKGKVHFSCTVYTKCTSEPPHLQQISLLLVQVWSNFITLTLIIFFSPFVLTSWLKVAMYLR